MTGYLLFLGLITEVFAAVPISAPAPACGLSAPQLDVASGQEIRVPVSLANSPGLAAMELDIAYDASVVEPLGADLGPLGSNMLMEVGLRKAGLVLLSMATSQDGPKGDGELLAVRFRVTGPPGQTTRLEFRNVRAWRSDNELEIPLTPVDGQLTVVSAFDGVGLVLIAGGLLCLMLSIVAARPARRKATASANTAAGAVIECANCRAQVAAGLKFCGQCGQAVPSTSAAPSICTRCGSRVAPEAKFCADCGQSIAPSAAAQSPGRRSVPRLALCMLLALAGCAMIAAGVYQCWLRSPN